MCGLLHKYLAILNALTLKDVCRALLFFYQTLFMFGLFHKCLAMIEVSYSFDCEIHLWSSTPWSQITIPRLLFFEKFLDRNSLSALIRTPFGLLILLFFLEKPVKVLGCYVQKTFSEMCKQHFSFERCR